MSGRETRNFMRVTVDSFSELPFIRPMPARERSSNSSPSIRLFGIEFPHEPDSSEEPSKVVVLPHNSTTETTSTANGATNTTSANNSGGNGRESTRKFECYYCCRNFPTSQALGGHQNAHKRERQHAKRAHLRSVTAAHHRYRPGLITHNNICGLLGYDCLHSVPLKTPPSLRYPSWSATSTTMSPRTEFIGSPLPGLWRISVHGGAPSFRSKAPPLFGVDDSTMAGIGRGGSIGSSSLFTSPQDRGGHGSVEKKSVSLDLRL